MGFLVNGTSVAISPCAEPSFYLESISCQQFHGDRGPCDLVFPSVPLNTPLQQTAGR